MLHGINEILPEQLSARRSVLQKITASFEQHGFVRVTTPTFEPYKELSRGWGGYLKESSIRFFNEQGVLMSLRPEMTSPVARLVGSRKDQLALPLKLYYTENVFRKNHILRKQEFLQMGLEYLGNSSLESDVEIIKVLIETLLKINIKDFVIDIGHIENTKNKTEKEIQALINGDYHKLKKLPLIGGADILAKKSKLSEFAAEWEKTNKKYNKYIQYNLGLVEEMSYYTGMIFNILIKDVGYIIGTGGRYDNLLKKYGWDIPAIGFAIEFEKLNLALKDK
ncbi:MAG: ATP phosphoribosyltransferase regulatory subunit [Candidatus Margulisbacteria bacterium]|nr:ATP phosphoribosyltransferase regulatory subunit [Candidatus Margulisiibacteriota bacterium]